MKRQTSQLDRLIARTRRRLLIADGVRLGGWWLAISTSLALVAATADRFLAVGLPLWSIVMIALSGLPIAATLAWRRRAAELDAAVRLDDNLRLKDLLGTAVAIDGADRESAMARWVREDAVRLAGRVDPRAAARIVWPISWGAATLLALACATVLWLVEPRNVFARPLRAAQIAAVEAMRQRAAESLSRRAEELRAASQANEQIASEHQSQAAQEALSTLDRLAEQFAAPPSDSTRGPKSQSGRGSESDAELSAAAREAIELAERLDREAEVARQAQRRAAERLAQMPQPEQGSPAEEFVESLRQGDLAAAAEWIESMEQRLEGATPEERARLAESLRRAAEQMAPPAEEDGDETQSPDQGGEALDELDLPAEQLEQWRQEPPTLDEIRRTLQGQGHDPIDAQQLAERVERDLMDRAADEQARRKVESAAERIRDLADTIDAPPAQESPEQSPPPEPRDGDEPDEREGEQGGERPDAPGDQSPLQPSEEPTDPGVEPQPEEGVERQGREPGKEGDQPAPAPQGGEQSDPAQPPQPGEKPGEKPVSEPGDKPTSQPQPAPSETPKPAEQPGGIPAPSPGDKTREVPQPEGGATPPPGEQSPLGQGDRPPDGVEPDDAEPGGARVTPPTSDPEQPGAQPGDSDQPPPTVGERARSVRELLDEIDRTGRAADRDQEISQEMRDAAKELLDQMSPQEREEIERWAAEKARERDGDGSGQDGSLQSIPNRTLPTQAIDSSPSFEYETEDVTVKRDGEVVNDRVIAEMYGPEETRPEGAIDRRPMAAEQVRQAAQAMERALNEEAIPPRYRTLIRNWARRLPQAVESKKPDDK